MHSLRLTCPATDVETVCCALWEAGTAGIREEDRSECILLVAGFEDSIEREPLSRRFSPYGPEWEREDDIDWVAATLRAWPARLFGQRIFLAPVWNEDPTPEGRVRVLHNPGMASGTGEHPCTQLALESLDANVNAGDLVVDVGTGSGILALTSLALGARLAVAVDSDEAALATAKENYETNGRRLTLMTGSADALQTECADLVVANISATVLVDMADELLRLVKRGGQLVVTGFPESEAHAVQMTFGDGQFSGRNEWRCLTLTV